MPRAFTLVIVLLVTSSAGAATAADSRADALDKMRSLRDSLAVAWDSGKDPAPVTFPNGQVRMINRNVLKSPRDAQYYAQPDKFPPVGYIALMDYRIGKLEQKIAERD